MKMVTAILLGAGQRGAQAYASYALRHPDELKFVAVAEPRKDRRREFQRKHGLSGEACFADWRELLALPQMADCALICTQDQDHCGPVMAASARGYHILCEKPLSPLRDELKTMRSLAEKTEQIFSVCHVLRFSPFFVEIKSLLDQGAIGDLVSMQHIEGVGYWHMAHSFVRGNWRSTSLSSPMILQKCCHDMDILLWLSGSRCKRVSSFGSLKHFCREEAPQGAPEFCMDGCVHRDTCPYYAPRFYLEHPKAGADGFTKVVSIEESPEAILKALKKGPYGRCVYHCDNDVVDHQVVNLEYDNGVTASMTMSAFTERCERIINLMGTRGQIYGNMEENTLEVRDFATGHRQSIHLHTGSSGHSGSDEAMMKSFVALVAGGDRRQDRGSARQAVESHLIALAAEESRLAGGRVIQLREDLEIDGDTGVLQKN